MILILWFPAPRGQHSQSVGLRHFLVSAIEIRLITTSSAHSGFQIVGNDQFWQRLKKLEGADMSPDPGLQLFTPASLGIGVVARSQHGYEQRSFMHRALLAIVQGDFVTRPVDEQLLARTMLLAHDQVLPSPPAFVVIAETTIGITFGMCPGTLPTATAGWCAYAAAVPGGCSSNP